MFNYIEGEIRLVDPSRPRPAISPLPTPHQKAFRAYIRELGILKDNQGRECDPEHILGLLPRWPFLPFANTTTESTLKLKNRTRWAKLKNRTRWANILRRLESPHCPLSEEKRKDAIADCRGHLATLDDLKDMLRRFDDDQKHLCRSLGVPQNRQDQSKIWALVVKALVNYLRPFYPITRRSKILDYDAVSQATYEAVAKLIYLAFPRYWPTPYASRIKRLYHLP